MKITLLWLLLVAVLVPGLAARADDNAGIEAQLAKQLGLKAGAVTAAPIPGLYRITIGPQVAYVSADGRYLVRGDIINLKSGDNLTSGQRAEARLAYLAQLDQADMIVFAAPHSARTITVFTDIDCDYCRVLERDRPALNAMGISVRYLSFPRDGVGSASWQKAVDVWCAGDRKAAFESAMRGATLHGAKCNTAAISAGYQFGKLLGLDGTPAIITDRGRLIDGYLPPAALAEVMGMPASSAATTHP